MNGVIATIPRFQFSNALGHALAGGKLYTYLAGSTMPEPTFQDQALTIENPNPITLDSTGSCTLWLDPAKSYKFLLKNAQGVTQPGWPINNVTGAATPESLDTKFALYAQLEELADASGAELIGHGDTTVGGALATQAADIQANVEAIAATNTSVAAVQNKIVGTNLDPLVIDMHFGTLCGTGWLGDGVEPGGYEPAPTTAAAASSVGSDSITVANAAIFRPGQLICYLAPSNTWRSTRVKSIAGAILQLDRPLPEGIAVGALVIYFYANDAHPNQYGYKTIADDAIRQLGRKEELAYVGLNYEIWSAFGPATVAGVTLGTITADSYLIPGGTENVYRAAKVEVADVNQGATSEWASLPAGEYNTHLVLNSGEREGGFTGIFLVTIEELRANGQSYGIASRTVGGYMGVRTVDIGYKVSPGSAVRLKIYSLTAGPSTFYLGKLTHARVTEHTASLNHGTHVLLGDSWFASGYLMSRLEERFPKANFVNKGVSGDWSKHLLARFDADVRPTGAHFVWLMCATNNYYSDVSPSDFEQEMNRVIGLVQEINAQPIVFNASVGDALYGVAPGERLTVSRQYALGVNYHAHQVPAAGIGAKHRTASLFAGSVTVPAQGSVVLAAIPGRTYLPAFLRYLYSSAGGLTIRVGYSGIIDDTTLVDQVSVPGAETVKDRPLPRVDPYARFVVIVADNPSGAPISVSLVADVAWVQA